VLNNLYFEIARQLTCAKKYKIRDLSIIAGYFEKAKEVSMNDFAKALDNQLTHK
jgi:hypothetical protein